MLDTPAESVFDEIALLAAQVTESPIALIGFIDGKREWFKAKLGVELSEISRDIAFCSQTILRNELLEVPDLTKDPRFKNSDFVTQDPKFRFYAGLPLITSYGYAVGAICVLDVKPKTLSLGQKNALKTLQKQIHRELENRRRVDPSTTKGILDFISRERIRA
jgi:GAF domain-containing protein